MSPGWGARQSNPLISSGPVVLCGAKLVITIHSCRWLVILKKIVIFAHECQESSIIMRPHTLIGFIISDRVLHDFRPMLHLLWQIIEAGEPFGA